MSICRCGSPFQAEVLRRVPEDDPFIRYIQEERYLELPDLEFRTSAGRWTGLLEVPRLYDQAEAENPAFLFSFSCRRVLNQTERISEGQKKSLKPGSKGRSMN